MTSLVYVEYHHPDLILMDMCTTLDAQVDSRHHMETSRSTGVEPLKRFVNKPYHYADFTPLGIDPWRDPNGPDASTFEPSMTEKAVASAKQILRSFRRRDTGTKKSNAKARRSGRLAAKRFTDQCMCSPWVVDSQAVVCQSVREHVIHDLKRLRYCTVRCTKWSSHHLTSGRALIPGSGEIPVPRGSAELHDRSSDSGNP